MIDEKTGYDISEELAKIKKVEFEIYEKFLSVCEKYNLKFFAAYGTMLGAVRHNDMIPWDDDMDFGMLREDYEKLCSIAQEEFKGKFFFQTGLNDKNYFFGYARIRNIETTGIIKWFSRYPHVEGIYIDIFVFDNAPLEIKGVKYKNLKIRMIHFLLNNYFHVNTNGIKKYLLFLPLKLTRIFISYEHLYEKFKNICCNDKDNGLYYLAACPCVYERNYFYKKEIDNLMKVSFGKSYTYIPIGYDSILKRNYGNYMEYPPVSERGKWHNDIITFDPNISYREFELKNENEYKKLNKEYKKEGKKC